MSPHFERQYQQRNNPGYTPEYKELEEARKFATNLSKSNQTIEPKAAHASIFALRWLAAEVRVMRLERALER